MLAADQALSIEADARLALETLGEIVRPGWAEDPRSSIAALNAVRFGNDEQLQSQRSYIETLRAAIPDEGILSYGINQMGYYSRNYYQVYAPDTYFDPHGNLRAALPIAMGAKVARPEAPMVACCGHVPRPEARHRGTARHSRDRQWFSTTTTPTAT